MRGILRSPEQVSLFFRHRRAMKGYLAISRGLIAIGAGDLRGARKSADEAARLSPGDPLALLLTAQSAQMAGDRGAAERAFRAMARRDDTKLLGLRGLYIEAQRRDDAHAARLAAEEAAQGGVRAGLGRTGGARLSLRRRRLGRRARRARSHEGRVGESRLSPQARRAAHRPRAGAARHRPRRARARRCWRRSSSRPIWCRRRRSPGGGWRRRAKRARRARFWKRPGRSIRIPTSPRLMRICGSAIRARERLTRMQKLAGMRAGPARRRAGGGARRARCARIRRRARGAGALSRRRRRGASRR